MNLRHNCAATLQVVVAAFVLCVFLVGCAGGGTNNTQVVGPDAAPVVFVTPTGGVSPTPATSPSADVSPTPTPESSPSPQISPSPAPSASASPSPSPSPTPNIARFTYVLAGDEVSILGIDAQTGKSRHVRDVFLGAFFFSRALLVNGNTLYVGSGNPSADIAQFRIEANGDLTPLVPATVAPPPMVSSLREMRVTSNGAGTFLYAAGDTFVGYYGIDAQGRLTALGSRALSGTSSGHGCMAVAGNRVFVALSGSDGIDAFTSSGVGGGLTPVAGTPFTTGAGTGPFGLCTDAAGANLYAALETTSQVAAFSIAADGTLTPNGSAVAAGTKTQSVALHPSGKFLYAAGYVGNTHTGSVTACTVNTDGTLTANATTPLAKPAAAPIQPAAVPITNSTSDSFGPCYLTVDPTGAAVVVSSGLSQRVTLNGIFVGPVLLALDFNTNTDGPAVLEELRVDSASGALTPLPASNVQTQARLTEFAITSGPQPAKFTPTFAYVTNTNSNTVQPYTIQSTGALTLNGSPVATGASPVGAAIARVPGGTSASGQFLFVANLNENTISSFPINADGTVGAASTTSAGLGGLLFPLALAVDPSGRFLYAANSGGMTSTVSQFTINPDGTLSNSQAAVDTTISSAQRLAIDPFGAYLAVSHSGVSSANTVAIMRINQDTGALVLAADTTGNTNTSPMLLQGLSSPSGLSFDPSGQFLAVTQTGATDLAIFPFSGKPGTAAAVPAGIATFDVAYDPLEFVMYAVGGTTIAQYTVTQNAALAPISNGTAATALNSFDITTDFSGRFVYVVNSGTSTISQYVIGSTGLLTPNPAGATVPTGATPSQIVTTGVVQ